jgi:thymidylate kinase
MDEEAEGVEVVTVQEPTGKNSQEKIRHLTELAVASCSVADV